MSKDVLDLTSVESDSPEDRCLFVQIKRGLPNVVNPVLQRIHLVNESPKNLSKLFCHILLGLEVHNGDLSHHISPGHVVLTDCSDSVDFATEPGVSVVGVEEPHTQHNRVFESVLDSQVDMNIGVGECAVSVEPPLVLIEVAEHIKGGIVNRICHCFDDDRMLNGFVAIRVDCVGSVALVSDYCPLSVNGCEVTVLGSVVALPCSDGLWGQCPKFLLVCEVDVSELVCPGVPRTGNQILLSNSRWGVSVVEVIFDSSQVKHLLSVDSIHFWQLLLVV